MTAELAAVGLAGPAGALDGVAADGAGGERAPLICVVLHAHPRMGGSSRGNVERAVFDALAAKPAVRGVLRFDFRGVGASAGNKAADVVSEAEDALAAVAWCRARWGEDAQVVLIGNSFGGAVALAAAPELPSSALAGVAWCAAVPVLLPARLAARSLDGTPVLLATGEHDAITGRPVPPEVREFAAARAAAGLGVTQVDVVRGADHFFRGHEPALVGSLTAWLEDFVLPRAESASLRGALDRLGVRHDDCATLEDLHGRLAATRDLPL